MRTDFSTLIDLIESSLPLQSWGFSENARLERDGNLVVIYNSQWCRIMFYVEKERNSELLHVFYGRLHALNNSVLMKWNGEDHYCWCDYYHFNLALKFLDGYSPEKAFETKRIPLRLIQDYFDSDFAKSIKDLMELNIKLQSVIWEHYGLRFFELFDLRRPDLWEKYLEFLKEYYRPLEEKLNVGFRQKGLERPSSPPGYKRC
jgi:hypothetical protein